jgi:hypothetical protein
MAQKWPEMAKNVYICDKRSPKRPKIAKYTELPKFDKYSSFGLFPAIGPTVWWLGERTQGWNSMPLKQ